MERIFKIIKEWNSKRKTGKISINFFQGGIPNINLSESVKLDIKTQQEKGGKKNGQV